MSVRHTLYTILAGLHLALVACGAANLDLLAHNTLPGHALAVVRSYTGSDAGYGFFAPGVSSNVRATFTLIDAQGNEWTDTLDANMAREAQLRVGSGVSMTSAEPDLMPFFVKSWAATMLGRHPTATTVLVGLEVFEVPPMDEYRTGEQAQWFLVFPPENEPEQGVFHRK